ncbi:hypothetical protein [Marinicella rhabdoformis]|uniref:hypothetical protein n=1 Tax=Marinicella rhabdoformis TaxID=2580566 RepID=UPI0012AEC7D2|nr:hypothetical protein [Marinicella rhabdoformis]
MALFFQIIGSIVVAIILIIVAIYLFIRIKFKSALELTNSESMTPMVVHLNESYDTEWLQEDGSQELSKALVRLGFEKGKVYDVIGMPDVSLQAFFNEGVSAVLYKYPLVGHWVDMVYLGESGEDVTVTNAVSGSEIDSRPECTKVHLTGASVEDLWQRIQTECEGMSSSDITAENFRAFFETAYQKDMAFIANKGGVTRAEFMRVHRNNPVKISDENLEAAFLETKLQEIEQWHEGIFSAHELEDYEREEIYFIVPETAYSRAFLQYLADYDVIPEEAVASLGDKYLNTPVPQIFSEINNGFSEKLRANHVTSVELPLKAAVFSKPYV